MSQSEGRGKGLFVVLLAVCWPLFAAGGCTFQPESIEGDAPDAGVTERVQSIESQREKNENLAELAQKIERRLRIYQLPNGDYYLNYLN